MSDERTGQDCGHDKCSVSVVIPKTLEGPNGTKLAAGTRIMTTCHSCRIEKAERERDEARETLAKTREYTLPRIAELKRERDEARRERDRSYRVIERVKALPAKWKDRAAKYGPSGNLALVADELEAVLEGVER